MSFKKVKWFVYVIIAIFLLFFSNDFGLINVEKTALVSALGIDKDENGFTVSAQIILPESQDNTSSTGKVAISGTGSTISGAISDIASTTGWYPKLSFCNLVVIGEGFLDSDYDIAGLFTFFKDSTELHDSSFLSACKGKANELLITTSPLDNLSSFALEKIFFGNINRLGYTYSTNVKDFKKSYLSLGGCSLMPIIESIKCEDDNSQNESGGSKGEKYTYDATTTAVYKDGKYLLTLNKDQTFCYNGIKKTIRESGQSVETKNGTALITVKNSLPKFSVKIKDGKPDVKIGFTATCKVEDYYNYVEKESAIYPFTDEIKQNVINTFEGTLQGLIEISKNYNVDLFDVYTLIYRKNPKYYLKNKLDILENVSYETDFNIKGVTA